MSEIVYIMTNPAMPDLIKIGITNAGTAEERRARLSSNENMPLPFVVYYAAEVENAKHIEKVLHKAYDDLRINKGREFFKVSPESARTLLNEFAIKDVTEPVHFENEEEQHALQKVTNVRSYFDFEEVGIKPGEILSFSRDESIKATVHDRTTILFNNEVTSVTGAVKTILDPQKTGNTYEGTLFWIYKGENLKERRSRIRGE